MSAAVLVMLGMLAGIGLMIYADDLPERVRYARAGLILIAFGFTWPMFVGVHLW